MTPQTTQARRVRPEVGLWRRGVAVEGCVSESSRYTETKTHLHEAEGEKGRSRVGLGG